MQHPFAGIMTPEEVGGGTRPTRRSAIGRGIAALAGLLGIGAAASAETRPWRPTTFALGEEGGATTFALGEEGGTGPRPGGRPPATVAGWEAGGPRPTTFAYGEEGGATTFALGEEGGGVTTFALGEEGGRR